MKQLRSVIFWGHLLTGTIAGLVILIMSATGAAMAFKPQILNGLDRRVRVVQPQDRSRLDASQLLAAVRAGQPGAVPASLTVDRDPSASAAVGLEREGTIYVNPYTGAILGEGSPRAQAIFRTLENWHRWIGVTGERRAFARSVTGACNLAFLALAVSGLFLWWPRKWTLQHTRPIVAFRAAPTGRARDFNWHNVIGFWCATVIVIMTATGVVMSYPWANDLLYRVTGSTPPSANGERRGVAGPGRPGGPGGQGRPAGRGPADDVTGPQIDRLWARAEQQMPAWGVMTMRLPNRPGAPVSFTMTDGRSWNAFARSQLALDAASCEVRQWQPYQSTSLGQKARGWVRFGHTGELGGFIGQLLAGVACAGGVVLVWTGIALAIRRLLNWIPWRPFRSVRAVASGKRDREAVMSASLDG